MSISIEELSAISTFGGRKFTRAQVHEIQTTVHFLGNLSRAELALTLCEHLSWKSPKGVLKIQSCLSMLEKLEKLGILTLPLKRKTKKRSKNAKKKIPEIDISLLEGEVTDLDEVFLLQAKTRNEINDWNALVEEYHYLGYQCPIGTAIRYFVVTGKIEKRVIGCILFSSASAFALESRDKWIGWSEQKKNKRLHLIIGNNRFLIFPWVKVKNLASFSLAASLNSIQNDWLKKYGIKPVLVETFVDPELYYGTCYKASNWIKVGTTKGRSRSGTTDTTSKKDVYVFPLEKNYENILLGRKKKASKVKPTKIVPSGNFTNQWSEFIALVSCIAEKHDKKWQVRKRVINSMLLVLLIFRLVYSKSSQSYGLTIEDLWDNADKLEGALPQKKAIAASSFSEARNKLDEEIFKEINEKLIAVYDELDEKKSLWKGHRVFGVDGCKIDLPRSLIREGFRLPSPSSHRPMGLVSCLYNLNSKIPHDFDLFDHENERQAALVHLKKLKENDLVVYDRGYLSYGMLCSHIKHGSHAIFRLPESSGLQFDDFIQSGEEERIIKYTPSRDSEKKAKEIYGIEHPTPLEIKLVRYLVDKGNYFYLVTTLIEPEYSIQDLASLYQKRWEIEEGFKTGKHFLEFENFHSKKKRGVKQELFAHFVLISMSRFFSTFVEARRNQPEKNKTNSKTDFLVNQKAFFGSMFKNIEGLFLENSQKIGKFIGHLVDRAARYMQRQRPGRSFERRSFKAVGKWRSI